MPDGQDRDQYAVGGGLVAGLSENIAERLAGLDVAVPGQSRRASAAANKQAADGNTETPLMATRKTTTKKKPASKEKGSAAARRTAAADAGPPPSKKKAATRKAAATKPAAKAAPKGKGNGGQTTTPSGTAFTEPTPGPEQRTVAAMLGEVVWLMTQSPSHKTFFLSDLEWLAMAPIMLKQFRVFYATDKSEGADEQSRPIGVVLWALVDEEVEQRLAAGNAKLRPQDWRSGDRLWVVDVIAPFGGNEAMLNDLKTQVFQGQTLKFRAVVDGQPGVREV